MALPTLMPTWSPENKYMRAGQENKGTLTLQVSQNKDGNVKLDSGDKIAIPNLPAGWNIAPDGTNDWAWTGSGKTGALTWQGSGEFTVPVGSDSQPISLIVTPPSGAQSEQVSLQLIQSDGKTKLSGAASIKFNLTAAQASLTAYAGPSAYVILTSSSALSYGNTIDCDLLALAQVSQTQLTLSFHGTDANGNPVDLSGSVDSVNLQITAPGMSFSNKGDGTWTANLPGMNQGQTLDVHITGLSISQTSQNPIVLLEVRCKTENDTASAWYTAFGPYAVGVALDKTNPDYGKYLVPDGSASPYFFYFRDTKLIINNSEIQTPLDWFILDASGQLVFPPVAARFSLNGQDPIEQQSEELYQVGKNTLGWVDPSGNLVAQSVINVVYLTSAAKGPFNFRGMDFSGWDFSNWTNLAGSDFTKATFEKTNLESAKLDNCNFTGASLKGLNLQKAELDSCNFTGAVIMACTFQGARFDSSTMDGVTITAELLVGSVASFKGVSFIGATFGGDQTLLFVSMWKCDMSHCNFDNAMFLNAEFVGCSFDSSTFRNATFNNVVISTDTDLTGTGSVLTSIDCSGLDIKRATIENSDVSNANFGTATFSDVPNYITSSGLTGTPQALPPGWSLKNGRFVKD